MSTPEELKLRFDELKSRLTAVHSKLGVPREDGTIVIDAGDLDIKCGRYQELVDQLLQQPSEPELTDELGRFLISLKTTIDDIADCSAGIKGPLDRLISAVYEQLPDDPRYADDTD